MKRWLGDGEEEEDDDVVMSGRKVSEIAQVGDLLAA